MRFNISIQLRSNYSIGFKNKKYIMRGIKNTNNDLQIEGAVYIPIKTTICKKRKIDVIPIRWRARQRYEWF